MSRELRLAERGFDQAFQRIAAAKSEDDAVIALHDALGSVFSLESFHIRRLDPIPVKHQPNRGPYDAHRAAAKSQGEVVAAMAWARDFAAHELVVTSDLGELLSDVFTETFGVLVWRDKDDLPPTRFKTHGRDTHYKNRLEGKPVPETLLLAREFFTDIIPKV